MTRMVDPVFKQGVPRSSTAWDREWRRNRGIALERDRGWCQHPSCDRPAQVVHHKKGRRAVDANALANLVSLCHACDEWCHRNPADARALGLMERHG